MVNIIRLNKGFSLRFCVDPEFDLKHKKKAEGNIDRDVVSKTIKMRSLVRIKDKNYQASPQIFEQT